MRAVDGESMRKFYFNHEKWIIVLLMVILLPAGFIFLDYYSAHLYRSAGGAERLYLPVDGWIRFSPHFVWTYLLYYPVCFLPLFLIGPIRVFRSIALGYTLQFLISFVLFAMLPIRMIRPEFHVVDSSTAVLKSIYALDPGYNIFPSLHVANAFLVAFIFLKVRNKFEGAVLTIVAILISVSALYVKQHYFIDIAAGLVLAVVTFRIAFSPKIFNLGYPRISADSSQDVLDRRDRA